MSEEKRRGWIEAVLTGLCFLVGLWLGSAYTRLPAVVSSAAFYQGSMAPSVLLGCGRGFINFNPAGQRAEDLQPLMAFLGQRADRVECQQIPPALEEAPFTPLQSASRYLLLAVGLAWKISGVSWSGLWWFYGLIYGTVAALSYRIARAMLGRSLSLVVTLFFIASPAQLVSLPHLRDYSKVPFFLGMFLILLRVVMRPLAPYALIGWSVAAGALTGIAFGVRFDTLVFLWFFIGAVLLFAPGSIRNAWRSRAIAAVAAVATFSVIALPILLAFELGNNSWHVIILGLSAPHDAALGIRTSLYQLGSMYHDSFVVAVLNAFWHNRHGTGPLLMLDTPAYANAGSEYFFYLVRTFPADFVLRAWAALPHLSRFGLDSWAPITLAVPADGIVHQLPALRTAIAKGAVSVVPGLTLLPLVATVGVAAYSIRLSLLAISGWVFFGGLSSLQFQGRHVVHLELLPLLFTALAIAAIASGIRSTIRRRARAAVDFDYRSWATVAAVVGALAIVVIGPLYILRLVQAPAVKTLLSQYARQLGPASAHPPASLPSGAVLFAPPGDGELPPPGSLRSEFLAAGFGGAACDFEEVTATLRYTSSNPSINFSRPITIRTPVPIEHVTQRWFATYQFKSASGLDWYRFDGVEVPGAMASCLVSLARVEAPQALPILVDAALPPNWESGRLYSILDRWESDARDPLIPVTYTFPPERSVRRSELQRRFTPLGAEVEYVDPSVSFNEDDSIDVTGWPPPVIYLVSWKPTPAAGKSLLLAEGEVIAGGLAIGLEQHEKWVAQVVLIRPGAFRVILEVPAGADVRPVVANNHPGGWPRRTKFRIDRIGWIQSAQTTVSQ